MFTEVCCTVSGKVQGVGFRDFVVRAAKERDLFGYVQNKPDGTVEACAQGTPDELKLFVEELNEGSVLAKVDSVAMDWRTSKEQSTDFEVRF